MPAVVENSVTLANIGDIFSLPDGLIAASSMKRGGVWCNEARPDRAAVLMAEMRSRS